MGKWKISLTCYILICDQQELILCREKKQLWNNTYSYIHMYIHIDREIQTSTWATFCSAFQHMQAHFYIHLFGVSMQSNYRLKIVLWLNCYRYIPPQKLQSFSISTFHPKGYILPSYIPPPKLCSILRSTFYIQPQKLQYILKNCTPTKKLHLAIKTTFHLINYILP